MTKSLSFGASLLCMAALICVGAVSARAGGTSVPVLAGRPTAVQGLTSAATNSTEQTLRQMLRSGLGAVNGVQLTDSGLNVSASLLPTIWSGQINWGGENHDNGNKGDHHGWDDDGKGNGKGNGPYGPAPTPEPSTLLSFGAALLIGGGVFLLGRLRKERK